ncbi:MAG TPA: response regulator [Planctomycetota bacterium]|nr:response regulator [Planctomycetota bacterium]
MDAKPKLLVVDDEAIIAASLQEKLKALGYDVPMIAGSAEEAVQMAGEIRPDLVLMDILLEGGPDGIEAAGRIRDRYGIPSVYLSAYSDDQTLKRAKLTEPYGYILKPVSDRELRIVVEIALYRNKSERALQLSEEKYRSLVQSAHDAIISADKQSIINYANEAAVRLFGYSTDELIGMHLIVLIPNALVLDYLFSDRGPTGRALEMVGAKKDGTTFPLELTLAHWKSAETAFYTAIVRDITERKHANDVSRKNAEMLEVNRAKDEFIAVISHELRTPLNAIYGWMRMLRDPRLPTAQRERGMDIIQRNVESQKKLIEDLLDVSRINAGKLVLNAHSLRIVPLIESAIEAIQPSATAKEINLELSVGTGEMAVYGDPDRLQQIVYNLLSNAIKFTPKGGKVLLKIQREGTHLSIMVSDTGIGIQPEFLPHIFERFRQADASITRLYKGLGLGLAIVRNLVELHGGAVEVKSEGLNKGATFTVKLPLAAVRPESQWRKHSPLEGSNEKRLENLRALVIEDENDSRDLLVTILKKEGAEVKSAGSVAEGLAVFDDFRPEVLVCDIGLPGQDGYSMIKAVRSKSRENGGETPAIALTAYSRPEDRIRAISSGFQTHICKPTDPDELIAAVAALVGR